MSESISICPEGLLTGSVFELAGSDPGWLYLEQYSVDVASHQYLETMNHIVEWKFKYKATNCYLSK